MRNLDRKTLFEMASHIVAGGLAVGVFGYGLLGTSPTGTGTAQAAVTASKAPTGAVVPSRVQGEKQPPSTRVVTKDFEISGMFCSDCVKRVIAVVRKVPGVRDVKVDLESGKGAISYEEGKANPDALIKAIKRAGYSAKLAG